MLRDRVARERDELRGLLRESKQAVEGQILACRIGGKTMYPWVNLLDRIEAALTK